ncbi:PilN domain-containing protein [Homoserinibacter sp. GY 40078]|uniref:PilN domain-containing protein n=1 Tax=Homoserinibacter sp. GY 40078 TaxID=2603275 RepID=UPI0011CCAB78|nr:hypothetical protein [Homoserinibacter sp. GY 40078]TXK19154.1 hypothetical protein FVQ89_04340 [Homoserinibacter sp. GY 40078]
MTATVAPPAPSKREAGRKSVPVGTSPRVSLLPPEIGDRNRQLGVQRLLRLAMFGVFILVVAAIGAAWYYSFTAQAGLAAEQLKTQDLAQQQLQYSEVQSAINAVRLGEAALVVGGSTEIDWQDYLTQVQGSLPDGVSLDTFSVEAATITEQYPQSTVPLEGARIATLQFTALSKDLPDIPAWLDRLRELPGFVDAKPGSIVLLEDGSYSASVTMHIDAQAYSNRLTAETEEAE